MPALVIPMADTGSAAGHALKHRIQQHALAQVTTMHAATRTASHALTGLMGVLRITSLLLTGAVTIASTSAAATGGDLNSMSAPISGTTARTLRSSIQLIRCGTTKRSMSITLMAATTS